MHLRVVCGPRITGGPANYHSQFKFSLTVPTCSKQLIPSWGSKHYFHIAFDSWIVFAAFTDAEDSLRNGFSLSASEPFRHLHSSFQSDAAFKLSDTAVVLAVGINIVCKDVTLASLDIA